MGHYAQVADGSDLAEIDRLLEAALRLLNSGDS